MPSQPQALTLLQLTDLHLLPDPHQLYRGILPDQALRAVLADARQRFPETDLLLLTGDLAQSGDQGAYQRLSGHLQQWPVPIQWLPGNHDDNRLLRQVLGPRIEEICLGRWRLVMLDSTSEPDGQGGGSLSEAELVRLQQALCRAARQAEHCLVVLHHPPVATGSDWQDAIGLQNAEAFWSCLATVPPVTCVLFGHLHQAWDLQRAGVRLLATPATSVQFKKCCATLALESEEPESWPGYRWLKLFDDGQIETGVVRVCLA